MTREKPDIFHDLLPWFCRKLFAESDEAGSR